MFWIAYPVILATSIAGLIPGFWWAVAVSALALTAISYAEHRDTYRRAFSLGGYGIEAGIATLGTSLVNSTAAALAAYLLGVAVRMTML